MNRRDAVVFGSESIDDRAGFVGRSIIDSDEFEFEMLLREETAKRRFDMRCFVASCHNDRHAQPRPGARPKLFARWQWFDCPHGGDGGQGHHQPEDSRSDEQIDHDWIPFVRWRRLRHAAFSFLAIDLAANLFERHLRGPIARTRGEQSLGIDFGFLQFATLCVKHHGRLQQRRRLRRAA